MEKNTDDLNLLSMSLIDIVDEITKHKKEIENLKQKLASKEKEIIQLKEKNKESLTSKEIKKDFKNIDRQISNLEEANKENKENIIKNIEALVVKNSDLQKSLAEQAKSLKNIEKNKFIKEISDLITDFYSSLKGEITKKNNNIIEELKKYIDLKFEEEKTQEPKISDPPKLIGQNSTKELEEMLKEMMKTE